jgi:putative ABC transport system ATP-binding protein
MVELKNISKVFRTNEIETMALDGVSLGVGRGEFVSIMGPSGCGKSTMLNVIGLLDTPSGGELVIDGAVVAGLRDRERARFRNQKLGFIFQSFHLIPSLNIIDNVELPLLYRKGVGAKERRERAAAALEKVGLSHRMKHFPSQLSGGQCQRAAIARAVVGKPSLILADEPTGNLDSKMGEEILGLLAELNREGATIVMVTHDEGIARRTSRIVRMEDGKLLA